MQLFQSVPQVGVVGPVGGVDAAEHHGLHRPVTLQRLCGGAVLQGDRIAHPGLAHVLDGGGDVAHLPGAEGVGRLQGGGPQKAALHHGEFPAGGHHADGVPGTHSAVLNPHVHNDPPVAVVIGVKNQRPEGVVLIPLGSGNVGDNPFQHLPHVFSGLGGDPGGVHGGDANHVFNLVAHPFRVGAGQVDLVHHRQDLQACVHRQVGVGQGLGLNALGGVHHQHGPFTGGQRPGHLVVKVHMAGGVDQIEDVVLPVLGGVHQGDRVGLDGDAPFPFQVHVVQQLVFHLPQRHRLGQLQNPVGQGGLAVVNVGHNAEIANFASIHENTPSKRIPHRKAIPYYYSRKREKRKAASGERRRPSCQASYGNTGKGCVAQSRLFPPADRQISSPGVAPFSPAPKRAASGLAPGKKPACPAGPPACVLAPAMLQGAALPLLAGSKKSRPWPCRRQEASLSRGVTRLRSGPCHATRRCSPPPRRFHKRAAPSLAPGKKPACLAGPPALSRGATRRGHPLAFWPLPCYNKPQYAT